MTEQFLQYIWKNRLFELKTYKSNTGEDVQIIHPGEHNKDAGPDFVYAKIRMGSTLWAGNCEVHINASDWRKHKHECNEAYENVVLHVVRKNDEDIINSQGQKIPTIEISYNSDLEENYARLLSSNNWIPCESAPGQIERFYLSQWLTGVSIERLEQRSVEITRHLEKSHFNWEECFYHFLAKGFGFKVNAIPFELLAKSLPIQVLGHCKNNLKQIEALIFGQSGLISESETDSYAASLFKEYQFLQKKYKLKPLDKHLWKFLRLRPMNFPTVRMAQFTALIHSSSHLFSKVLEAQNLEELKKLFNAMPSSYWETHYSFGIASANKAKPLANDSIELLLVNTVIPFLFVYGKSKNLEEYRDKAISLMEEIKPEKNSIIEHWKQIGVEPRNMLESQALLQLKNEYCNKQKCLQCIVGNKYISNDL